MSRRVKVSGNYFHGQVPDGAIYVSREAPCLKRSPYANPFPVKTYGPAESLRLYRSHARRLRPWRIATRPRGQRPRLLVPTRPALPRRRAAGASQPMAPATTKLNTALITMASQGSRPRCADPIDHQLWTSEDQHDRDIAAARCTGCQVLVLCHQAAEERERSGVCGVAATEPSDQGRGRHDPTTFTSKSASISSSAQSLNWSVPPRLRRLDLSMSPAVFTAGPTPAGPILASSTIDTTLRGNQ